MIFVNNPNGIEGTFGVLGDAGNWPQAASVFSTSLIQYDVP